MKLRDKAPNVVEVNPNSRRMFLKSATGLTLSLPMMSSLLTAYSEKALADATPPLRYVQMWTCNGGLTNANWFGTNLPTTPLQLYANQTARIGSLSGLATASGISPVLDSSFNSLFAQSNLLVGVDQPYYFGHGVGQQFGTFAITQQGSASPYSATLFDSTNMDNETMSLDQVIAYTGNNGIYNGALGSRRRSLNFGSGSCSWTRDVIGSNGPIVPHAVVNGYSTAGAFTYLFGAVAQGQSGQTSANPILNLVNSFWPSGKQLLKSLSLDDRYTLERFFQLAQDVSENYVAPPSNVNISLPAGAVPQYPVSDTAYQALADIITMGFQADATRIVTLLFDSGIGQDQGFWHTCSHSTNGSDSSQDSLVQLHNYIAKNFVARLGTNLMAQDPLNSANSMLHNSLIVWQHEHKSPHHNYANPTLMLGAAGGRIKTDVFADLRKSTSSGDAFTTDTTGDSLIQGDLVNRLFASIFYSMNIPRSSYEISRGQTPNLYPLTKGYGHAFVSPGGWAGFPAYDLSRIGEPWEFLTKPSTVWG